MAHIRGQSRTQAALFPLALDELIPAHSPVRVIDAFVEQLDLAVLEFGKVETAKTGRPPYHPADLLKLYIYGYLNQVRSSRRLEREAGRNVEVLWLLNRLQPDFKTIANFRKDNVTSIVKTCRAFMIFCREQGLFGAEIVAIDGSKFQAVASREQHFTEKKLEKLQAWIDRRVAEYLKMLDATDGSEPAPLPEADVRAALEALEKKRTRLQGIAKQLQNSGEKQLVATEPEAKLMGGGPGHYKVAYNVQTAVDAKHKLIVGFEVTNDVADQEQLHPMAHLAKEELQVEKLTVLADAGYRGAKQAALCEAEDITAVLPTQRIVNTRNAGLFTKDQFIYDAASDTFRCPAGETLKRLRSLKREGVYRYGTTACPACPLRSQCTKATHRGINHHMHAAALEAADRRARNNPKLMRLRSSLVEHPFGGLKYLMGTPKLLLRGKRKAKAEMALTVLGYNLKRVMNILGAPALLQGWAT